MYNDIDMSYSFVKWWIKSQLMESQWININSWILMDIYTYIFF